VEKAHVTPAWKGIGGESDFRDRLAKGRLIQLSWNVAFEGAARLSPLTEMAGEREESGLAF
jgi:hypothetical protein